MNFTTFYVVILYLYVIINEHQNSRAFNTHTNNKKIYAAYLGYTMDA